MDSGTKPGEQSLWTKDFILITLANLFIFLGFQMLLPVLPVYSAELGGTEAWAGLVVGTFTFSAVIMRPLAGRMLDRQGRRGVYLSGLGLFLICVLAYHWAPSILILLMIRFLHGFGWGASSTAASTIASDIIPKSRLGEGMGYFGLTGTLAMSVAPALGLSLMSGYGFGAVFNLSAASVVIALLLALPIAYHKPDPRGHDGKASIFEKTAQVPAMVIFFVTMTYGSIVSFIALYAADRQVENIGLFFTVYAIALLISRPFFGRIADRRGYSSAVFPGILAVTLAMVSLYFAGSLVIFLLAGFIYGIGFGAIQPALQAMAVRNVAPSRRGAANATFFLGFDLGIGAGSILWGFIAEMVDYRTIYLLAVIPALMALFLYYALTARRSPLPK